MNPFLKKLAPIREETCIMNQAFTESPRPAVRHSRLQICSKHRPPAHALLATGENQNSNFDLAIGVSDHARNH